MLAINPMQPVVEDPTLQEEMGSTMVFRDAPLGTVAAQTVVQMRGA